jgi:hypothetical protein
MTSTPVVEAHGLRKAFGEVQALAGLSLVGQTACRQFGQVYASKNGRRGTYSRDADGHLMEILTPASGEPA